MYFIANSPSYSGSGTLLLSYYWCIRHIFCTWQVQARHILYVGACPIAFLREMLYLLIAYYVGSGKMEAADLSDTSPSTKLSRHYCWAVAVVTHFTWQISLKCELFGFRGKGLWMYVYMSKDQMSILHRNDKLIQLSIAHCNSCINNRS